MMAPEKLNYVTSLKQLLMGLCEVTSVIDVTGVAIDSREVESGNLFIAYKGSIDNGIDYIDEAIQRGASAIIIDELQEFNPKSIPVKYFRVTNLRKNAGHIISRFYGCPSKNINIVGVTGTNGKTTVSYIIAYANYKLKKNSAFIGTLGYGLFGQIETSKTTTPDAVTLHSLFSRWETQVDSVAMEVSSHALDQGRVEGTEFDMAVFTNLSRDHLDYHNNIEDYINAKFSLFEKRSLKNAVINIEDSYGAMLIDRLPTSVNIFAYSNNKSNLKFYKRKNISFVYCESIEIYANAKSITIQSPWGAVNVRVNLLGEFNVANILAAFTVLCVSGLSIDKVAEALSSFTGLPGRMEVFSSQDKPLIIIDYAHTPDALKKALTSLRDYCKGQLFCIFGCGGGRDIGKRAQMGSIAESLSDHIVLTNDNPRDEPTDKIFSDILEGIQNKANVIVKPDRSDALITTFLEANKGDIILLAGKGHEVTQQIGANFIPFSDRELAKRLTEVHI